MSKPIHKDAALVSQAIKAVDGKPYDWTKTACCLGGRWAGVYINGDQWRDFNRLSNIALSVHLGLSPDATDEDRKPLLSPYNKRGEWEDVTPVIPFDQWEPVKTKLYEFYNLADERILV